VPITGVADFAAVAQRYAELAREQGAQIRLGCPVATVHDDGRAVTVEPESGAPIRARVLVNCAGLFSDRIARAAGAAPPVRILPFRGEYYELAPAAAELVRGLVYPVPDPAFPFLGVHLTRGIDGNVHAGPNAVLAFRREGYRPTQINLRDLAEVARYRGFWRLARKHWRAAVTEYSGSLSRRVFANRVRRMLPDVRDSDLVRGAAGVRAQAVGQDGQLIDDFLIVEQPRSLHVLNAPSPAATASLPIGNHLAAEVDLRL
jgi:(S)-2-hydroxyglutarate dehydrogenase